MKMNGLFIERYNDIFHAKGDNLSLALRLSRYHCPYCAPRYQFYEQRSDGVMVCGLCGDPLAKTFFIKPTQIFALLVSVAFVAPFIALVFSSFKDLNRQKPIGTSESIVLIRE